MTVLSVGAAFLSVSRWKDSAEETLAVGAAFIIHDVRLAGGLQRESDLNPLGIGSGSQTTGKKSCFHPFVTVFKPAAQQKIQRPAPIDMS